MVRQLLNRRTAYLATKCASCLRPSRSMIASASLVTMPITTCTYARCFGDKPIQSGSDLHSLYLEQMNEINADREAIFGPSDPALDNQDISQLAKTYADQEPIKNTPRPAAPPEWNAEDAYAEREALFQFTSEEKSAWTNFSTSNTSQMNEQKLMMIKEALAHRERIEHAQSLKAAQQTTPTSHFTHLNPHQNTISMVDVGNKLPTRRIAKAQSTVTFPPEVMSAFQHSQNEMVGPKGPIFETARLAGIMGAKKTSDLIPLCHPLPLDRVHVDIQLVGNRAIVECECCVTHKTGVEMEVSYLHS